MDTSDGDFTEYGTVVLYRAHSAAQRKKPVSEDWQFCCYFMIKAGSIPRCTYLLTQCIFFIIYCKLRNICRISFVVASLSKPAGYDKTYTNCVLYFMIITDSDPLCKLSVYIILSPSVLLSQTLYIGIVRNVLINICEYAKVLHT